MNDQPAPNRIEAAARAHAADLEFTVPLQMEGEHGWYAVAERALAAADAAQK
jgi:hypothetical protein